MRLFRYWRPSRRRKAKTFRKWRKQRAKLTHQQRSAYNLALRLYTQADKSVFEDNYNLVLNKVRAADKQIVLSMDLRKQLTQLTWRKACSKE